MVAERSASPTWPVVDVRLSFLEPKALLGLADIESWSYNTATDDLIITTNPTAASFNLANPCDPTSCPSPADLDIAALIKMAAMSFASAPADASDFVDSVDGLFIGLNGQYFVLPARARVRSARSSS